MNLARRLTVALSLPAFAAFWVAGLGLPSRVVAGDPPQNPTKPDPGMGDPAMGDPAAMAGDPVKPAPVAPVPPANQAKPLSIADFESELAHLKEHLKNSKSDNGDILASLDAVNNGYHNLIPPAADADAATKAAFEESKKKDLKDAEGLFQEAYLKKRVKPNTKANDRDDVNIKAIQIIGQTESVRAKELTSFIIKSLEGDIFKAKDYDPPTTIYDESYKAIALLNDHGAGWEWVTKKWLKYDNSPNAPEKIKAAFDAVILFKDVKGADRHDLVQKLTTDFVSVENAAEVNKDKNQRAEKQVWDKIKGSVIKAIQVFSGQPKGKAGALLATVKTLQDWFNDHDKDPIWKDTVPPKK